MRENKITINPIIANDNNVYFTNQGVCIVAFEIIYMDNLSISEKQHIDMNKLWCSCIDKLPDDTTINFFTSSLKIPNTIELPNQTELDKIFKKTYQSKTIFRRNSYVTFQHRLYDEYETYMNNPLVSLVKQIPKGKINQKISNFVNRVNSAIAPVRNSNQILLINANDELEHFNHQYFNLFQNTNGVFVCEKKELKSGDKHITSISVTNESNTNKNLRFLEKSPKIEHSTANIFCNIGDCLSYHLPYDNYYSLTIYKKTKAYFESMLKSTLNSYKMFDFRAGAKTKINELENYINLFINDSKQYLVFFNLRTILFDKDLISLNNKVNITANAIYSKYEIKPNIDSGDFRNHSFVVANPLYASHNYLNNFGVLPIGTSTIFIPSTKTRKPDKQGFYAFDSNLELTKIDLFDENKKYNPARNTLVIAPTGRGKSTLFIEIVRQLIEENINLCVVELGGSFERASYLFDNAIYIKFDNEKGFGYNPFKVKKKLLMQQEHFRNLVKLIELHVYEDDNVSEPESLFVEDTLKEYINTHNYDTLHIRSYFDFIYQAENIKYIIDKYSQYVDYNKLRLILAQFVTGGQYDYLHNERNDLKDITSYNLVGINLDKVKSNKKLLTIATELALQISYLCTKDKNKNSFALFDEFGEHLKEPKFFNRGAYYFQAIRKNSSGCILILQTIGQMKKDHPNTENIISNTDNWILLQDENHHSSIKKYFEKMPSHTLELAKTLTSNIGEDIPDKEKYVQFLLHRAISKGINYDQICTMLLPTELQKIYANDGKYYKQFLKNNHE